MFGLEFQRFQHTFAGALDVGTPVLMFGHGGLLLAACTFMNLSTTFADIVRNIALDDALSCKWQFFFPHLPIKSELFLIFVICISTTFVALGIILLVMMPCAVELLVSMGISDLR